jgi:hypothetical protein
MDSHSDYSLRASRTGYTAIYNWATRASCNTVSISWFTEPNMWCLRSGILAVPINKQHILSFVISRLETFLWLRTEPDNIQGQTWLTQNSLLPNPYLHIILNRLIFRLITQKCLIWHIAPNNKQDKIFFITLFKICHSKLKHIYIIFSTLRKKKNMSWHILTESNQTPIKSSAGQIGRHITHIR